MLIHHLTRALFTSGRPLTLRLQVHRGFSVTGQKRTDSPGDMIRRTQIKRVLCVAEKNDAAKCIAEIMSDGRARRREGLSVYNKLYEFEYNLFGRNVTVCMTSVSGHLLGLEFKAQFQKWHSCNPVLLFDAEVEKYCPENFVQIKRTLEREVSQCQALVIWTDCDREGENIGFEVIDVCKAVKPGVQVFRARFSEITPNSIRRACDTLTEPDGNVSDAVDVRQELDLRIGASFTRFQTLRLQKTFPASLANQLISYGSCQFPTLGFVVERFKSIQAFIPETFYKIRVLHEVEEESVEFSWKRNRLFNHTACLVIYQICLEDPIATVISVTSKPKSKWRPLPLDTVEMEKLVSRKLRIGAKETMKIAEKLYTQGLISYPRTETNLFPKDLALGPLVEHQTHSPSWGAFARGVMEQPGGPNPRQGTKTDQAHPPIHPIKYTNTLQGESF
ncbi:DNA topoisomerase 3-alpha-like [Oncorhynchus clarkii lewisi]|uniref:DNA topoisomerase 3-alpha-like n=1 Tax=Oncorhynchus clarkii lewisi TaxID=490388 RepID=UPI0039B87916